MKICKFCGGKTEDSTLTCANCGSQDFSHICPNCSTEFDGSFCPTCGTRFDAVSTVCPQCSTVFYSKSCPNCGYNPGTKFSSPSVGSILQGRQNPFGNASTNTVIAFVLSLLGIMTFLFPLAIVGLVLALKEKKKPEGDTKLNRIAIILSCIVLGVAALTILTSLSGALFSLLGNH